MSVAATWIAVGYLPIARSSRFCSECAKVEAAPAGLRCTEGRFYVNRTGGCRLFAQAAAPAAPVAPAAAA